MAVELKGLPTWARAKFSMAFSCFFEQPIELYVNSGFLPVLLVSSTPVASCRDTYTPICHMAGVLQGYGRGMAGYGRGMAPTLKILSTFVNSP